MSLLLTAQQCFFIVILAFAVVGFQRGWKRELVSLGCSLGAVLFLYLGGGNGMAHFLFITMPVVFQDIVSTSATAHTASSTAVVPATDVLFTTVITFVVIVGAGYLIGNRAFPRPNSPHERLLGILPAVVSGYFLMLYVTNVLAKSPLLTLGVNTPNQGQVGNSVFVLFLIALVVVLAALVAASARKPSGGKK